MYLIGYLALEEEKVRRSVCVCVRERKSQQELECERQKLVAVVVLPPVD